MNILGMDGNKTQNPGTKKITNETSQAEPRRYELDKLI
jgi:hypothetical protein